MSVWRALGTCVYWTLTAAEVAIEVAKAARHLVREAWRGKPPVSSREDTTDPIPLTLRVVPRPYHGDPPDAA